MARQARKIVEKTYYYYDDSDSESESESDDYESDTPVGPIRILGFRNPDRRIGDPGSETESETESESESISDSDDTTDYETESEPESDSEQLDEPKPYYGEGFRVYFDSHEDKRFFMKAFGFN